MTADSRDKSIFDVFRELTPEQLRERMREEIRGDVYEPDPSWGDNPAAVNYMFTVMAMDYSYCTTTEDLELLLELLEKACPSEQISIHEGWPGGGMEADSNLDLITGKLLFDLHENGCMSLALFAAVELEWIDANDVIAVQGQLRHVGIGRVSVWFRDNGVDAYLVGDAGIYCERAEVPGDEAQSWRLSNALRSFDCENEKDEALAYLRMWCKAKGHPLQPYDPIAVRMAQSQVSETAET